jgi:GNAT superfamily N-acetyltransferase
MAIRVRGVEEHDRDAWLGLFRDYIAFYGASVPDEVVELTWTRLVCNAPDMIGLVAVGDDGRPVGLAILILHRSSWSASWYCYLEDLYVAPVARGQGVGRLLVEAVYRVADERGATRTYWVTEEDNATARALYDRIATRVPFVQYRR